MEEDVLLEKQKKISTHLLPVTVSAAVIVVIGIVGNIFTIVFFSRRYRRSVPFVLIKYLAIIDLFVCTAAIPVISEMSINVRYTISALCKISHFLGNSTIGCSCLLLLLVNIDRYRKICYPLGRQIPLSAVKYVVIVISVVSALTSVSLLVTFDINEVNVTVSGNVTSKGYICAARCDGKYKLVCLTIYGIDFIVLLTGIVLSLVMYSRIIYTLLKRRFKLLRTATVVKAAGKHRKSISMISDASFTRDTISSETEISTLDRYKSTDPDVENASSIDSKANDITIADNIAEHKTEACSTGNHKVYSKAEVCTTAYNSVDSKAEVYTTTYNSVDSKAEVYTTTNNSVDSTAEVCTTAYNKAEVCTNKNVDTKTEASTTADDSINRNGESYNIADKQKQKVSSGNKKTKSYLKLRSLRGSPEVTITLMMFTTVVVFIVCFIPYFVIRIFIRIVLSKGDEYNFSAGIQFALKLPYLNSAFNPIIYSIFNIRFRRYIKRFVLRCCPCRRD